MLFEFEGMEWGCIMILDLSHDELETALAAIPFPMKTFENT